MYEPPASTFEKFGLLLRLPLPTDKVELMQYLVLLEKERFDLGKMRCEWLKLLHESKAKMRHPKDKDLTDLDRTTMLNGSVAFIQRDYEFLVVLEKLVEDRLELGKLLLTLT